MKNKIYYLPKLPIRPNETDLPQIKIAFRLRLCNISIIVSKSTYYFSPMTLAT